MMPDLQDIQDVLLDALADRYGGVSSHTTGSYGRGERYIELELDGEVFAVTIANGPHYIFEGGEDA